MKTIVTYVSKTGFTQQYAQWIAESLNCDIQPFNGKTKKTLCDYDLIIFGGGIMAGMVNGLKKFKSCPEFSSKKVIVFATGATDHRATKIVQGFGSTNLSDDESKRIPFFFFESGINYEGMGFFPKTLLKMMVGALKKKENPTAEEKGMLETIEKSCNKADKSYIEPLIEVVKK